jgi:3-hydroxy-9,10-secoandrosta-1,3,5(10)-triene-9,17-dione monooxygenase
MTIAADVSEQSYPLPPEPNLTPADVVARAESIALTLVERQEETEQRTYYAQDTHEAFSEAGFYRILVPRRYGGYEFDIETFLRVTMALTRGCPSTGWMYCLGASHAMVAATFFGERAQAELFRSGEFIAPTTVVPTGSAERADNGEWVINGTWPYSSGAPYSTHSIHHTLVFSAPDEPPVPMMFVAPRDQYRVLDDWGKQLGLKGSGSHTITFDNARIPGDFGMPAMHLSEVSTDSGTPGRVLHGNPQYGGGPLSFMMLESASLAVGMALGALDAYGELLRSRTTLLPPVRSRAEDPDFQFWYGEAAGMIDTAQAAVLGATQRWRELSEKDPGMFTREEDLRITGVCRHAIGLAWRAVESYLFPTAGSSAVRQGERIERVWRDMSMMHTHAGLNILVPTVATRELTQTRFGIA